MSKQAADLMTKLSTDPKLRERFKANPDEVMDEAGIPDDEKQVLKSGDPDRIRQHFGDDSPPGCFALFV